MRKRKLTSKQSFQPSDHTYKLIRKRKKRNEKYIKKRGEKSGGHILNHTRINLRFRNAPSGLSGEKWGNTRGGGVVVGQGGGEKEHDQRQNHSAKKKKKLALPR